MDFVPDYNIAKKELANTLFGTYSQAYTVTNEDLRKSMRLMPKRCDDALVVAGSGDHPLFCSLYGAKNVDTFDISYNAKCIMDIKTVALNCLGYHSYIQMLDDVYMMRSAQRPEFKNIKNMPEILSKLPKIESEYIYNVEDYILFSRGFRPKNGLAFALPDIIEYYRLREKVRCPYNFMLTSINKFAKLSTKSYDFIHLSNVLDYIKCGEYPVIIQSLMEHVKPGGRIVSQFVYEGRDENFEFHMARISSNYKNWMFYKKKIGITKNTALKNGIYVLERVR